jgi:hypothetical protein
MHLAISVFCESFNFPAGAKHTYVGIADFLFSLGLRT